MSVIALAGQKGGSGKTTTSIALAAEFRARGRRVLLVDADPQGSVRTWAEVAAEAGHTTPTIIAMGATMHQPGQLIELAKAYDVTVIDCPPRHGEVLRSALMVADLVVLPCGPSAMDAWALAESIELVGQARSVRPALCASILLTRKMARTALGAGAREVAASSGLSVLTTELHYRVAYQEAPAAGLGVAQYEPNSAAALEIRTLVDELGQILAARKGKHEEATSSSSCAA